jgi:hypothetical protein
MATWALDLAATLPDGDPTKPAYCERAASTRGDEQHLNSSRRKAAVNPLERRSSMYGDSAGLRRVCCSVLLASAVACFAAAACSDIHPEANDEGGGVLESPTNEADTMRQEEGQQEENREMGGGGGGGGRR